MHTSGIRKKEYTNMSQQLEFYALFHEQSVCGRDPK